MSAGFAHVITRGNSAGIAETTVTALRTQTSTQRSLACRMLRFGPGKTAARQTWRHDEQAKHDFGQTLFATADDWPDRRGSMSATQKQAEQYAAQIALLIQSGKLPTLEQVQAAIQSTAAECKHLIEAAESEQGAQ